MPVNSLPTVWGVFQYLMVVWKWISNCKLPKGFNINEPGFGFRDRHHHHANVDIDPQERVYKITKKKKKNQQFRNAISG